MKKLFVSQPMRNLNTEEISTTRMKAIEHAKELYGEDLEVLDSQFNYFEHIVTPLGYLAKSIELLSRADVVYFAPGWKTARGCLIEHTCAFEYGLICLNDI